MEEKQGKKYNLDLPDMRKENEGGKLMDLKRRSEILLPGDIRLIKRYVDKSINIFTTTDKDLEREMNLTISLFNPDKVDGVSPKTGASWSEVREAYISYAKQYLHRLRREAERVRLN